MKSQQVDSLNRALKIALVGTSQRHLSKRARIEYTRLSKIVHGVVKPDARERKAIARILAVPVDQLFAEAS